MSRSKKGFTIVELVIVIAVVAILAAVLIPSFSSLNKKAKDSAYLQERTNQQIADLAEKVENQKLLSWEDLEAKLAEELAKIKTVDETSVTDAIAAALAKFENSLKTDDTALTEAQVKAIVEKALEGQLTTAQVEGIVKAAVENIKVEYPNLETVTEAQIKAIVDNAVAGLNKQTGITADEMKDAITAAMNAQPSLKDTDVETIINKALAGFGYGNDPSISDIQSIIEAAMGKVPATADDQAAKEMTAVIANVEGFDAAVKALTAAGYNVSALTPIRANYVFYWAAGEVKCDTTIPEGGKDIVKEGAALVVADVADVASFEAALTNGNSITLKADIEAPYSFNVDKDVTINLNGNVITAACQDNTGEKHYYAMYVKPDATLTLENGTVASRAIGVYGKLVIGENVTVKSIDDNGGAAIWIYEGGEAEISGGTFTAQGPNDGDPSNGSEPGVINNGGTLTIKGGTFTSVGSTVYAVATQKNSTLNIEGGTFTADRGVIMARGTVNISGGTFTLKNDATGYPIYATLDATVIVEAGALNSSSNGVAAICALADESYSSATITLKMGVVVDGTALTEDVVLDAAGEKYVSGN